MSVLIRPDATEADIKEWAKNDASNTNLMGKVFQNPGPLTTPKAHPALQALKAFSRASLNAQPGQSLIETIKAAKSSANELTEAQAIDLSGLVERRLKDAIAPMKDLQKKGTDLGAALTGMAQAVDAAACLASITFSGQRQLFFPISDNYPLGLSPDLVYAGAGRSRG